MPKHTVKLLVVGGLGAGAFLVGSFADSLPPLVQIALAWLGVALLVGSAIAWLILELVQDPIAEKAPRKTANFRQVDLSRTALPGTQNRTQKLIPMHEAAAELYGRFRQHNKKGYAVVAAERSARIFQRQDDAVLYYYGCWLKGEGGIYGKVYPSSQLEKIDFREYENVGVLHVEEKLSEFRYHGQGRNITDLRVERATIEKVFNKFKDWLDEPDKIL